MTTSISSNKRTLEITAPDAAAKRLRGRNGQSVTPLERTTSETFQRKKKTPPLKKRPSSASATPLKYYPASQEGKFALTPTAAKARRVIYTIVNTKTEQRYVGKTEQELRDRLNAHHFGIAHPEKKIGQKPLYKEIRENPQDFQIGILLQVEPDEDIIATEAALIEEKKAYDEGYNATRGGGAQKTGSGIATIPEAGITPKKYYPLHKGTLKFDFSPTAKKTKKVIYVIYDQKTDKRYVGKTEQELRKRFNSHHSKLFHMEVEDEDFNLYQEMRKRPKDFFAGILYQPPGEEDDLEVLEAHFIEEKNSYLSGYNRTRGTPIGIPRQPNFEDA